MNIHENKFALKLILESRRIAHISDTLSYSELFVDDMSMNLVCFEKPQKILKD